MNISRAERLQIENEMIFRRRNEKVGNELGALDAMHLEDGHVDLMSDKDLKLQFRCECSDENCLGRITMLLTEYQKIHADRDTFIVLSEHQVDAIEKILRKTAHYTVVKKNNSTSEPSNELNVTTIDNS
jgi:hypothetical protein